MSIRKYFLILLLLFGFVFSDNPICVAEKLETVTIQLKWFHQFQFAGYYAAIEKDFYAEEMLDVILKERDPHKNNVQSVVDGDAEYGVADTGLLLDRMMGKPVVLLKQIFQHSPLVFLSLKDSGIISPYEMTGKKIMFNLEEDATLISMLLETLGGLDKITIIPHSFNIDDLVSGKVDVISAYIANEPLALRKKGIQINVINPQDYGIDFYGDNLFTTEEEVENHPERIKKMIRATLKGWEYALSHQQEIIDLILKKYNPDLSRDKLIYEAKLTDLMILAEITPLGTITIQRYEKIAETFKRAGHADGRVDLSEFIYGSTPTRIKQSVSGLTEEEKAWLKSHPVIRVANEPDYVPFDFQIDGEPAGYSIDYVKLLADKLGFRFEFVQDTWGNILKRTEKKEIDLVHSIFKAPKEREEYLNFTKPYKEVVNAIVVRNDRLGINSLQD